MQYNDTEKCSANPLCAGRIGWFTSRCQSSKPAADGVTLPPTNYGGRNIYPHRFPLQTVCSSVTPTILSGLSSPNPLPNSCSAHRLNPPNYLDEMPSPLALHYSASSLRSIPCTLSSSAPSSLPYVRAHLNICLKHRKASYFLYPFIPEIEIRIIPSSSSLIYMSCTRSRQRTTAKYCRPL